MELSQLLRSIWKRKWLILLVTILGTSTTFFIHSLLPGSYTSSSQIATGITDEQVISFDERSNANNYFAINNKFSSLIENIKSRQVINMLCYRLLLHDLSSDSPFRSLIELKDYYSQADLEKAKALYKDRLDSFKVLSTLNEEDRLLIDIQKELDYDPKTIRQSLFINRVPSTDYIKIQYSSSSPLLSAFVVNSLSEEFIRYYVYSRGERSSNSVGFLKQLVKDKKEELDAKVEALREFKSSNEVVNLDKQSEAIIAQIKDLETKREEEKKKIISLKQAIKRIDNRLTSREVTEIQENSPAVNTRIIRLRQEISELNKRYISDGSKNTNLLNQITKLREDLSEEISKTTSESVVNSGYDKQELINERINNEVEVEIAKASVDYINKQISRLRNSVSGFANKEAQQNSLEREISVSQNEYLNLLDKLNDAQLMSRNVGNSIRQVETGLPADEPMKTSSFIVAGLSGTICFSLSITAIILLSYLDRTPRNGEILRRMTNLPLIGTLNQLKLNKKSKDINLSYLKDHWNDKTITEYKEMLRKARYEIEQSGARKILFTSVKEGQGKTTTMISLAYALHLNNKKVLLIDGNFRNNQITRKFKAIPYLGGEASQSNDFSGIIARGPVKGIDIVGCESGNFSPSEIFSSIDFNCLLKDLEERYDFILVEGANLNEYSDSKELINFIDKTITVFSSKLPIVSQDDESISYLRNLNGKMLGTLLNQVDLEEA